MYAEDPLLLMMMVMRYGKEKLMEQDLLQSNLRKPERKKVESNLHLRSEQVRAKNGTKLFLGLELTFNVQNVMDNKWIHHDLFIKSRLDFVTL